MDQRGRKSSAALSVVARTEIDGRPHSPDDLTDRQKEIWDRTVANEAADVFKTAALQQLLKDYCCHVATSEALTRQINRAIEDDSETELDNLTKLVRLRDCETKASADKATKLRLTNQARYTPQAAATAAKGAGPAKARPWQSAG
jgi:hypothetical protein